MRHALFVPPFGELSDPNVLVEVAVAAEEAGWDGMFLWDHLFRPPGQPVEVADPWISLAAIAATTGRLRIGPLITPLTRRRPQKVAREAVTLDQLSGGRLTLGVGLGVNSGGELERFGESIDAKVRADRLDEALEVILALWSGEEVDYRGRYFTVDHVRFLPRPVQEPRIPVWGAARSGCTPRPLRRAAALDGLFPVDTTPEQLGPMLETVVEERGSLDGFDVAMLASVGTDLDALSAGGVTWAMWSVAMGEAAADVLAFALAGPAV